MAEILDSIDAAFFWLHQQAVLFFVLAVIAFHFYLAIGFDDPHKHKHLEEDDQC